MALRTPSLQNDNVVAIDREIGSQYDNVKIVAENIESVVTVAGHIDNVDTVATNIVDVHAVGGSIVDVRTIAANINNVVTVGQDIANVNTVAANVGNIDMIVTEVLPNINEIANASANAAIATTKANETTVSAANALVSAQDAKASELAAAVSKNNAAVSETTATTKANEASSSAAAAHNSELAAEALLDAFNDRYLGSFAVDPTTDNDGQPLLDGALYYNTVNNVLKVYDVSNVMWYTIPQVQLSTLLDVQLTSVTTGDVLTWNGSKWINTRDVILNSLQLRGGTGTQGTMTWNADEETVDVVQNGAVLQLGQETQVHVRNSSGSSIADGKVVMATGALGSSGRITAGLYDGTSDVKYVLGVATETIAAGDDGKVTNFGKIRGINTSAWNEGDVLYATAAGGLTNVVPTSGKKLAVAFVITKHAVNGTIMVRVNGVDELAHEPKNANIQSHIASTSNPHLVTKAQIGLSNVDNTADSAKAVLTATKLATPRTINGVSFDGTSNITVNAVDSIARIASSEKGVANGVATLDGSGLVPSTQLPSYVDDVLEYSTFAGFPATGAAGKIYVDLATNKTYRWSGSAYVYITSGAVDSVAGKTGIVTLAKADVGLGNVDNTADINKNVLSATKWTTGRTITIGATGKTVDGSGNVSWSLAEIGAQASGNYQPLDATLTALAGVTTAADKVIYATGVDTFGTSTLTAAGRALIDDVDAAAQRTTLGISAANTPSTAVGGISATNVQAAIQELDSEKVDKSVVVTSAITSVTFNADGTITIVTP